MIQALSSLANPETRGNGILLMDGDSLVVAIQNGDWKIGIAPDRSNGMPDEVWHNRVMEIGITKAARPPAEVVDISVVASFIAAAKPLLDRLAAGHSIEWDGPNHVGILSDEAQEALDEMSNHLPLPTSDRWSVWKAGDWLDWSIDDEIDRIRKLPADKRPSAAELAAQWESEAADHFVVLLNAENEAEWVLRQASEKDNKEKS